MRHARRHVTEVVVLSCLSLSVCAPAIVAAMGPLPAGGDTLTIDAVVHVDAAGHPLTPVSTRTGTAIAWHNADHSADHAVDGHLYTPALRSMADMRIAYLRYPSGEFSNCFDWQRSVGAVAQRPKMLFNGDYHNNNAPCYELKTDVFGTDEFMAEIEQLSTLEGTRVQPVMTVNVCSLTAGVNCGSGEYPSVCPRPQEVATDGCPGAIAAAQWVEYLNGAPTTQFGAQRVANSGHVQPYGVRYFEIGNETPITETSSQPYFSDVLHAYVSTMRAVDPTIKILAQGDCGCSQTYRPGRVSTLLATAGQDIDFVAPHLYMTDGDLTGAVSRYLDALQRDIDAAGYHDRVGIFPTEWTAHDDGQPKLSDAMFGDMATSIADASEIQAFISHGVAGSIFYSLDSEPFHLLRCSVTGLAADAGSSGDLCASRVPALTPPGQLLRLLGSSIDPWGVSTSSSSQLRATTTAGEGVVHVQLVNDTDRDLTTAFSFDGLSLAGPASLSFISGPRRAAGVLEGAEAGGVSPLIQSHVIEVLSAWQVIIVTVPARSVSVLSAAIASAAPPQLRS